MNSDAYKFATFVAVLILIYFIVKEALPYCREISVESDGKGALKLTAFTHNETELADANPPLVMQGN